MPFILFVILKTLPKCVSIDLKIEICMAAARILLHWFHVWKYAKLQIMLLFAYETSMKEMQLHYVQYNLQFVSSTGRFPFSWNFHADRKFLILELSMRNRDIWKTSLKRWDKKKLRIFNFLGGFSRKKIINQSNLGKT